MNMGKAMMSNGRRIGERVDDDGRTLGHSRTRIESHHSHGFPVVISR